MNLGWIVAGTYVFPLTFFAASALVSLRYMHMLQLSSYQTGSFWRWLRGHVEELGRVLWPALPVLLLGVWPVLWTFWVGAALLVAAAVYMLAARPKVKKPLKLTARAGRVLGVQLLLAAGIAFGGVRLWAWPGGYGSAAGEAFAEAWQQTARVYFVWYATFFLAMPLVLLAANWLTLPLQRCINRGYVRDAQRRLAACPDLLVIGVTGSYGKTSVKHFLQKLLSVRYSTLMTPESYNTPMGVVRAIRENLDATHEVFVCEMGARHEGDVREICEIVRPRHGVVTSVGEQHLETFGSIEAVARTKLELSDALPPDGLTFLGPSAAAHAGARSGITYAVSGASGETADYRARDIRAEQSGLTFTVEVEGVPPQDFRTQLLGAHNVENLLAAIAVAHRLGIPMEKLAGAVRGLTPVAHRLQLIPGDPAIIDDAFNSNPIGAKAALDTLGLFPGTKILITPGMVELGARQDACNEQFGAQAAEVCDFICLVGEKQTRAVAQGARDADFPAKKLHVFATVQEAIAFARALDAPGRVILLENDLPDNY